MTSAALPKPEVSWPEAYEVLRELGRALPDARKKAFEAGALITGMQAGEPIDEWMLGELFQLSGLDLDDDHDREATASAVAMYAGAGILDVTWQEGSPLALATAGYDGEFAARYAEIYRNAVVKRMYRLELILKTADDNVELD